MSEKRKLITKEEAEARARHAESGIVCVHTLQGKPIPERQWLVPNLIPRGAVTLLSGDGGTGKSLLAMQLMSAGALGLPWVGIDVPRFTALGLFCEDDIEELHRRQAAINEAAGRSFADLAGLPLWPRAGEDNVLLHYPERGAPRASKLMQALQEIVRESRIELIVIDTAADVFGGNENIRGEVRSFLQHLHGLASICNGAVLLTAHPSVAGQASGSGLSGSTAWNNSVRSRLYLTRPKGLDEDDSDARELRGMKANYAAGGARFRLRWQAGVFVREASEEGYNAVTAIEQRNLARKFAELVAIAAVRGLDLSPNPSGVYAPNVLAALPEANGLKAKALVKPMHDALREGLVRAIEQGPPSKRRLRLAPGAQAA